MFIFNEWENWDLMNIVVFAATMHRRRWETQISTMHDTEWPQNNVRVIDALVAIIISSNLSIKIST